MRPLPLLVSAPSKDLLRQRRLLFRSFSASLVADSTTIADDDASFVHLLDQCRSTRALCSLDSQLRSSRRHLLADSSVQIKLMRASAACGDPALARRVFDEAPCKTTIFFNVMIRSYVNLCLHRDALGLFAEMGRRGGAKPDHYTFPCVLKACSECENLACGLQVHASVSKLGLDANLFVGNALITMYSRCGLSLEAFRMFDGMPNKDVVSWNAMIAGYACNGQLEQAIEVCKKMVAVGVPRPDAGTMASVLPAMTNSQREDIEFLRRMFDEMRVRNLISWNAMIAIYANNSMSAEALEVYLRMEMEGVEPDAVTFASVLPACGDSAALVVGKRIHELIRLRRMCPNMVLENALMDMYANCGCLEAAREVFNAMSRKDVVSWTSIIAAYGMHGRGHDATALFEQMQKLGIIPDSIAFVSILSACSYAGLLDEGKYYFSIMTNRYLMVPRIEHYACMVDLLGRAGNIDEAYDFIKQMPVKPNERVWGALLSACRVHSNMDIGLIAADSLFELVPEQSGYYVLLSNIYARAGRWEEVTSVRNVMVDKGIKKSPGCSNVELGNKVHTFHIGDTSHEQSKQIYVKLDDIMARLKELGYTADTETALHDVEDEDKAGHLSVHSEKLAIAFMLINTTSETPIRIKLNLRMCGDCHLAAKLISSMMKREIVLRDTNRFHHFAHGVCSCGDYW